MLLAATCGVAVGNVYFPQVLSPLIAVGLHAPIDLAALTVSATQLGYTAGIFLLVPLADRVEHRNLIVLLLGLTGAELLVAASAPSLTWLLLASVAIGATTVVAPIIAPLAVELVPKDQKGWILGLVLSGSIGGILLARTFSGTLAQHFAWRAPYLVAGGLSLLLAVVLRPRLPRTKPGSRQRYGALVLEPLRLLRAEPELRRSALYQATVFGGFSAVWTTLTLLLTGPVYRLPTQTVGLFALVSAATLFCTPLAGRWIDRRGPDRVTLVCLVAVVASAAFLAGGSFGGRAGLGALGAGVLLLDVAMQSNMVANQARILTLRPQARARVNTAYMTCAYLGGALGSWMGALVYSHLRWPGVCALLGVLAATALGRHLVAIRSMQADNKSRAQAHVRPVLSATRREGRPAATGIRPRMPRWMQR